MLPPNPHLEAFLRRVRDRKATRVHIFGPMPTSLPETCEPALYIDGGVRHLNAEAPHLSLGDEDSGRHLQLPLPRDKEASDLAAGLQVLDLWQPPPKILRLFGFLGGDKGHEWCGIFEVSTWLAQKNQTEAHFEDSVSVFSPGRHALEHRGLFTAISLGGRGSLEGALRYPTPFLKPRGSHGLHNCANGRFVWQSNRAGIFFWSKSPPRDNHQK